jgi:hypothetical protein
MSSAPSSCLSKLCRALMGDPAFELPYSITFVSYAARLRRGMKVVENSDAR